MRDHTKLQTFQLADELALAVYEHTQGFPQHEHFGLRSQLRRSAVSVPSNIVEGSARHTEADYIRFLDMAYGSARELEYQLSLAHRLGYLDGDAHQVLAAAVSRRRRCSRDCSDHCAGDAPPASSLQSPASAADVARWHRVFDAESMRYPLWLRPRAALGEGI